MKVDLASSIRNIPDFPKPGVQFKDITTLLKDKVAFRETVERLVTLFEGESVDEVVGIEARGFAIGAPVAYLLGSGFIPVRKKGKLPGDILAQTYDLEYGSATLEIHRDAIQTGQKIVVIDDLLATGGTAQAVCKMIEELGGRILGLAFVIELASFHGRKLLPGYPVHSLLQL
ncbi:MAG: adenine phosphoribosyltransferase [Atribacterota bacterium]